MQNPNLPYNALPLLPPALEIETKPVLKRCITARAALAALRLAGQLIPNQSVLINSIPLLEAKDSSAIENIVTTNDALFRQASLLEDATDPSTREALRYRTALYEGFKGLAERPISTRTAVELCRQITGIEVDLRATPRTALRNSATGETIYTPPEGQGRIAELMSNWERFVNQPGDLDPLVRMAIQHYQFEAIHPFHDGNGRTGRILNILCLVQDQLLDQPTLYLSRHILRSRPDYYRLLERVTSHQDWESWLIYMLTAVEVTAGWTNERVNAIRQLMEDTSGYVRSVAPKIHSRELVEAIFIQPYCRIAHIVERGIAKRQSAAAYLKILAAHGVLTELKAGRDKLFLNTKYLELLASDGHDFTPYQQQARVER